MTSLAISQKYNKTLAPWQHKANADYLDQMWQLLNVGGIYCWKDTGKCFRKCATLYQWEEV